MCDFSIASHRLSLTPMNYSSALGIISIPWDDVQASMRWCEWVGSKLSWFRCTLHLPHMRICLNRRWDSVLPCSERACNLSIASPMRFSVQKKSHEQLAGQKCEITFTTCVLKRFQSGMGASQAQGIIMGCIAVAWFRILTTLRFRIFTILTNLRFFHRSPSIPPCSHDWFQCPRDHPYTLEWYLSQHEASEINGIEIERISHFHHFDQSEIYSELHIDSPTVS